LDNQLIVVNIPNQFTTISDIMSIPVEIMSILDSTEGMIALTCVLATLLFGLFHVFRPPKQSIALANPDEWLSLPLVKKEKLSHDVCLFRFGLQSPEHVLGLPIGQHISFKFNDENGKLVQRSYTPTSCNHNVGHVDFVIKVYFKDIHPKFPNGGKMSQYLNNLQIGEKTLLKGPKGNITYNGRGMFEIKKAGQYLTIPQVKKVGFIAGGTGITPVLQVIRAIMRDPHDHTEIFLIYANQTEEDILLRDELESLPKTRLRIWYTLDRPPINWDYGEGFINTDMCREHLPPGGEENTHIFCCGPPPMIKFACEPAFQECGIDADSWTSF
jgi:cytochrome-b5 reductase